MTEDKKAPTSKCHVCSQPLPKGKQKYCSTICATRADNLKRRYGITSEEVVELYRKQQGRCAICDTAIDVRELGFTENEPAHIDHLHGSDHVRGLLCSSCNLGLGHFRDNRLFLKNAIKYITKTFRKGK